jgi:mannosyltransferase
MAFVTAKESVPVQRGVVWPAAIVVLGLLLVVVATIFSSATLEAALVGSVSRSLAWGPDLFRALLALHGAILAGSGIAWMRRGSGEAAAGEQPSPAPMPWMPLLALSVVALGLRLWALGSCLWFDEVLTLVDFVRPPLRHIVSSFPSQNQHMFFSLLAHGSLAAFGESAWALRLPSVAFGVASIWALFLLGRQLVGRREALLACTLMVVSYHHVWFSQNARGYMGLLFFATLSTWLWLEAQERRRWSWHVAYAVAVALGMWTHLTMVFVPLSHALLYAADLFRRLAMPGGAGGMGRPGRDVFQALAGYVLAATLTLQLYALSLPEFLRTGLHEVSLESAWTSPLWVVTESLRSLHLGFGALGVVAFGALIAGAGWLSLARRNWLAAAAMVLPPLLGGTLMLVLGHNLWPRFFFFAMGFALLIAVHGAMTFPRLVLAPFLSPASSTAWGGRLGTIGVVVVIVASALSLPRAYALPKQDFTGARAYVEAERRPGDAVVAVGLAGVAYSRYFAPEWQFAENAEELQRVLSTHPRVWLVYTLPVELEAYHPDVWEVVHRDFDTVRVFPGTLGGGEVLVCQSKAGGGSGRGGDA